VVIGNLETMVSVSICFEKFPDQVETCFTSFNSIGAYFIDIDSSHFDRVMHYLRYGGKINYDNLSQYDVLKLKKTVEYLQLATPKMKWCDSGFGANIAYSNDSRKATVMNPSNVSFVADRPIEDAEIFITGTCVNSNRSSMSGFYIWIGVAYRDVIVHDVSVTNVNNFAGLITNTSGHKVDFTTDIILKFTYNPASNQVHLTNNSKSLYIIMVPKSNRELCVVLSTNVVGMAAEFV